MTDLVVFVAGAGETAAVWAEQARRLEPTSTLALAAADLCDGAFAFDRAVEGLHERILASGAARVVLAGLSVGAMIATRYAAARPEQLAGLVLSGGQVRPPRALMALQRAILRALPARAIGLPPGTARSTFLQIIDAAGRVDLTDSLPRIAAPTIVLCGSRDRPNLPAARRLAEGIPDAELRLLPGGHQLHLDAPDGFHAALRDTLIRA